MGQIDRAQCESIIAAAEQTAIDRKSLPPGQTPIMAQGWLSRLRFLDNEVTQTEIQQQELTKSNAIITELSANLTNAKRMLHRTGEAVWEKEVQTLTEKLNQARAVDE